MNSIDTRTVAFLGLMTVLVACSGTRARRADEEGLRHWAATPSVAISGYDAGMLALRNGGELKAAEESFALAVRLSPEVATYHYHLAKAYWRGGQKERAVAQLQIAAGLDPPSPEAIKFLRALEAARRDELAQDVADAVADRLSR